MQTGNLLTKSAEELKACNVLVFNLVRMTKPVLIIYTGGTIGMVTIPKLGRYALSILTRSLARFRKSKNLDSR